MNKKVLLVDDEEDILNLLSLTVKKMKLEVDTAVSFHEALAKLAGSEYSLCLTDMQLDDGNGLDLISHIHRYFPSTPVAMITAFGNMETAVEAMKLGAFDYISKPVDINKLRTLINNALSVKDNAATNTYTFQADNTISSNEINLAGEHPNMLLLKQQIKKVSLSLAPVHIYGENGTGKELVARIIHAQSARSTGPFVVAHCGTIAHEMIESEFFGHKQGAFLGALTNKVGLFQEANGGTLFLDEIAELPISMQVKLLRVIQDKSIKVIGDTEYIGIDVRIISATHRNLQMMVADQVFRQDLYYRLNVIRLETQPLRAIKSDIIPIAKAIISRLKPLDSDGFVIEEDAKVFLENYDFVGNMRELENMVERALILCENNTITKDDLIATKEATESLVANDETLEQRQDTSQIDDLEGYLSGLERDILIQALHKTKYNKTKTAEFLGISFRSLRYRLKKLGID